MCKLVILAMVLAAFSLPGVVQAQEPASLASTAVSIWPEYDRPDVLVIYRIELSSENSLPAKMALRIPLEAREPIDPLYIGRAPFPPALHHSMDIKARDWGLKIAPEAETVEIGGCPPCQVACPVGINGQDFLYFIAQSKYDEALEEVRRAMPFAGVCGRGCTHPCEPECERGKVDDPLSIPSLHRFVADHERRKGRAKATPIEKTKEEKVAIIGSGPAGLACAYELVRRGYPVTVFEAAPKAGGMLRYGIPDYRLPKEVLDDEISYIQELGVEIKTNRPVRSLKDVFAQGYKAIFLATGAWVSERLNVPNEDAKGVFHALDILRKINSGNERKNQINSTLMTMLSNVTNTGKGIVDIEQQKYDSIDEADTKQKKKQKKK